MSDEHSASDGFTQRQLAEANAAVTALLARVEHLRELCGLCEVALRHVQRHQELPPSGIYALTLLERERIRW